MQGDATKDRVLVRSIVIAIVVGALLALVAWWLAGLAAPSEPSEHHATLSRPARRA